MPAQLEELVIEDISIKDLVIVALQKGDITLDEAIFIGNTNCKKTMKERLEQTIKINKFVKQQINLDPKFNQMVNNNFNDLLLK